MPAILRILFTKMIASMSEYTPYAENERIVGLGGHRVGLCRGMWICNTMRCLSVGVVWAFGPVL